MTRDVDGFGTVCLRHGTTDLSVFRQVFEQRQYDISWYQQTRAIEAAYRSILERGRRPVILDLGANVGLSAVWFAVLFPEAEVVAVEPNAGNAEMARINARGRRITVVEAAIGGVSGRVRLTGSDEWAFRTVRAPDGGVDVITVRQALALVQEGELLLVKVDIEGFEDDLFAGDVTWIDAAAAIFIEPHDWMLPKRHSSFGFQKALGPKGFDLLLCGENLVYVKDDGTA